jgi:hypothetical protein
MSGILPMHVLVLTALLLASTEAATRERPPDARTVCPMIYQPVCARKDSEVRTFANSCFARRAGFAVVAQGNCGGGSELPRFGR